MSSQIPTVRHWSAWRMAFVLTTIVLFVGVFALFRPMAQLTGLWYSPVLLETVGALSLYLLLFGVPKAVLYNRYGVRPTKLKRGRYEAQAAASARGIDFFSRHPGLDRLRWLLFGEISRYDLREIAMMNRAYALWKLDRPEESLALYERIAAEYPDNKPARETLAFRDTIRAGSV